MGIRLRIGEGCSGTFNNVIGECRRRFGDQMNAHARKRRQNRQGSVRVLNEALSGLETMKHPRRSDRRDHIKGAGRSQLSRGRAAAAGHDGFAAAAESLGLCEEPQAKPLLMVSAIRPGLGIGGRCQNGPDPCCRLALPGAIIREGRKALLCEARICVWPLALRSKRREHPCPSGSRLPPASFLVFR
jgi:hypothetical protein